MYTKEILAAVAATASLTASKPLDLRAAGQRFTVDQVSTGKPVARNPASVYRNILAKYKATIPQDVAAAAVTGSAPANPGQNDEEYTTPVTIGSGDGATLQLDFDTGSADLWVFSSETPQNEASGHTTYDTSSGKKLQGSSWTIQYGDGSGAAGDVYADQVVVGGVTATSQAVEAATSVSGQSFTGSDGLLGLASSSINTVTPDKQTTFFDTVKATLADPLFTATLKKGQPGSYDFGYIDDSKHTGDINYVDVDFSQGFWQFDTGSYTIGKQSGDNFGSAIADTGTTLLLAPDQVVTDYYGQVQGSKNDQQAGGYTVPCDADLPDFTIEIGSSQATVPGSLINYAPNGDGTCFGGIQGNQGLGFSILGDIFLKSQFVVFDGGKNQIGFAPQASS